MPSVRKTRHMMMMAAAVLVPLAAAPAGAAVIVANPLTDFSTVPTTITLAGVASFTFSYLGDDPYDATYSVDAVETGGKGLVNTVSGEPIPFGVGSLIGPGSGYNVFLVVCHAGADRLFGGR